LGVENENRKKRGCDRVIDLLGRRAPKRAYSFAILHSEKWKVDVSSQKNVSRREKKNVGYFANTKYSYDIHGCEKIDKQVGFYRQNEWEKR
jgi:hypothetical protein